MTKATLVLVALIGVVGLGLGASAKGLQCESSLRALGEVDEVWQRHVRNAASPSQMLPWLTKQLKQSPLRSEMRARVDAGENPIQLGAHFIDRLALLYWKEALSRSELKEADRKKLEDVLLDWKKSNGSELPLVVEGQLHEKTSELPADFDERFQKAMRDVALMRCVSHSAVWLATSLMTTLPSAALAHWNHYAKDETSWHMVRWDAAFVLTLGAFHCLSDKPVGNWKIAAVAAGVSLGDELIFPTGRSTGEMAHQILVDFLFARAWAFKFDRVRRLIDRRAWSRGREILLQGGSDFAFDLAYPPLSDWLGPDGLHPLLALDEAARLSLSRELYGAVDKWTERIWERF